MNLFARLITPVFDPRGCWVLGSNVYWSPSVGLTTKRKRMFVGILSKEPRENDHSIVVVLLFKSVEEVLALGPESFPGCCIEVDELKASA